MDNNKIGRFIASLRKEKQLTQKELGDKLFVTDKAVSKWERGLSLPDITILESLAKELGTDIYSILQIDKKEDIAIDEILQKETDRLNRQTKKKIISIMFLSCVIIGFILFKLAPLGYNVVHVRYLHNENKLINLAIPKFSFLEKTYEDSFSYKNFRGKHVLESEIKNYVNTLVHITCNDTTYFYDEDANITIIDYTVKGNLLYNTISYSIQNGNYCSKWQRNEYSKLLGTIDTPRKLYALKSDLNISFIPSLKIENDNNSWLASMEIFYHGHSTNKVIEKSSGTFEIKNGDLIYYRTKIEESEETLEVPNVSRFAIKDQKLILKDNYLNTYEKSITLK